MTHAIQGKKRLQIVSLTHTTRKSPQTPSSNPSQTASSISNTLSLISLPANDYGLFLSDEDPKKGIWLEAGKALDYYMLRNGVSESVGLLVQVLFRSVLMKLRCSGKSYRDLLRIIGSIFHNILRRRRQHLLSAIKIVFVSVTYLL